MHAVIRSSIKPGAKGTTYCNRGVHVCRTARLVEHGWGACSAAYRALVSDPADAAASQGGADASGALADHPKQQALQELLQSLDAVHTVCGAHDNHCVACILPS